MASKAYGRAISMEGQNTRQVRVGRLTTVADIRVEVGKLYKSARRNAGRSIDAATALRLAQILNISRACLMDHELTVRVKAALQKLEADAKPTATPGSLRVVK
jgi:hypothetical protein